MDLVKEGKIIQELIRSYCQRVSKDYAKIFANLLIRESYFSPKNLTFDPCVGVHKINDDVINALKQKHPKPSPILKNTLLNGPVNEVLPCYYDNIDEEMVSKASSLTKGVGGPSQLDAMQNHHLLSSRKYEVESKELRTQIAIFG